MSPEPDGTRPAFSRRVPRWKIARLYEADAAGILDEDLIDDVGYALLDRCLSIFAAEEARDGRTPCPECGAEVLHAAKRDTGRCEACGWEVVWVDYLKSLRKKQFRVGGMGPILEDYVAQFPRADTPRKKMIQIDNLLHRYHWEMEDKKKASRPTAVHLIGGSVNEVMAFLSDLTYSEDSTPGLRENYNRWRKRGRRLLRRVERRRARAEKGNPTETGSGPGGPAAT